MKIILIGPPGAGKGTQSILLQKHYQFQALSSGNILRQEVNSGSDLGQYAKTFLDTGRLLPDEIIVEIMIDHLHKIENQHNPILLDGFPRTVGQAQELDRKLKEQDTEIDAVIIFQASRENILERLSGRLSCSTCGAIYHIKNRPPIHPETCDTCKGKLMVRTDDKKEAITKRLDLYDSITYPVIDYYTSYKKAYKVDADLSEKEVFDSVCHHLNLSHDSH